MSKIVVKGSWGNLLFTGFDITIKKKKIVIDYGDNKNNLHLTYPYKEGTSKEMFNKFIDKDYRDNKDFIIDRSNFYLYNGKTYLYNLVFHEGLEDDFFETLNQCLGFSFKKIAVEKWEKIIKDGYNEMPNNGYL
jgi:hypothetical protein